MSFKLKVLHGLLFLILLNLFGNKVYAFKYDPLPADNLIKNPWFYSMKDGKCYKDVANPDDILKDDWYTSPEGLWGTGDKAQQPIDVFCPNYTGSQSEPSTWYGFGARFADKNSPTNPFSPNVDAKLWQIVQSNNPANKTLKFHSLIVAHMVNKYKAEIYGGPTSNGPWTSVWIPFDLKCDGKGSGETPDCVNDKYGPTCNCKGCDRHCLWDDVTEDVMKLKSYNIIDPQGPLKPVSFNSTQGYAFYKIEFLMNYPEPDSSSTGNVGGKLARVYFTTSGSGINPTNTPIVSQNPTPTPISGVIQGDIDKNGVVNIQDFTLLSTAFGTANPASDIDGNGIVNIQDYTILSNNFGKTSVNLTPTPSPTVTSRG